MIARPSLGWATLIFTLQVCAQNPTTAYLGKWVVKDVLCSDCGKRLPAEKNARIEFSSAFIRNPLAEDCTRDPGYSLLNGLSGAEVVRRYGSEWPGAVRRAIPKQGRVHYGFITCGGINLMQMLFVSDKRSFYFFEGGVIFDLQRVYDPDSQPHNK